MQQQQIEIDTGAALAIIGMNFQAFRTAVDSGDFTGAPPAENSKRLWTVDEMCVLSWFHSLVKSGAKRPWAGGCAGELAAAIKRDPDATFFHVYMWTTGTTGHLAVGRMPPDAAPKAQILMTIPLAELRTRVRKAMDRFLKKQAAMKKRAKR